MIIYTCQSNPINPVLNKTYQPTPSSKGETDKLVVKLPYVSRDKSPLI